MKNSAFAKSSYEDFFAEKQRQKKSFPSRFEDYCEIFGGLSSSSSIPVLDFPASDAEFCQVIVDYSEIFGGLKRCELSSLDGSARWDVLPQQQSNESSEHLIESYAKDHLTNLQITKASSGPQPSHDASSKHFSISYHKTNWGIIDDLIDEKTNTAKLDVPEFTAVVDASDPVLLMKNQQVNSEISNNTGTNMHMHDGELKNEAPFNSSSNATYSEILQVDQAPSNSMSDSLLDASDCEKHHSRSSSYHSASSGDISLFDVEYLNISEISLQTKPLQVPPPSRPPPQLIKMPEPPKKYHMHSSSSATKIDAIDEHMKDSSGCNGNEMDPNSAAAAAVKAAMEQAQAQLKIARELMDRKRDKYKRKVDHPKAMTCEEDEVNYEVASKSYSKVKAANNMLKEEDVVNYEVASKSYNKVISANNMLKENSYSMNEYTFLEREEISNAGTTSLKHEKGQFPSSGENQQNLTADNDFKLTEAACEFGELSDEWKSEKNELVRNGGLLNEVEDNCMHENEKKAKKVMFVCQDIYQDSKKGEQAFKLLENQNTSDASCWVEKLENDHNLNGASISHTKDSNNNFVNAIMEDFVLNESASKLDETQKEGDIHEDNTTKDGANSLNPAVDSCLSKDNEMFQVSSSSFKPGINSDFSKEIEFYGAETIYRNVGNKMEFHVNHVNFELNGSHKLFNSANEVVLQERSDEKSRMPDVLCSNNTTEKMEVAKETRKFHENFRETESQKYLNDSNVSEFKVEENNKAAVVDDADGLQANEEACILTKNELEKGTIHNANGLEYGKERRDAPIELHEDESVGPNMNQELNNFEFLAEAKRDYAEKESESASEVQVACNLVENDIISTSAKESHAPEIIFSGNEDNSQSKAPDTTKVFHAEVVENHQHSIHKEEEENKTADKEKEWDKERVMRLEEKEREREREKDRIHGEITNHDTRQRAFVEARERAERIAVERVTSEARQRALAEAREKADRAEKALRQARLRERAAVERVTEEARQRAIEKALADKAAIEARSRMRKDNATSYFKAAHVKEDSETRFKSSSDTQFQNPCSTNGNKYSDSCDNGESESKLRCKARQERQQRTTERAAKALNEKNMRDILAQREQAERDRLAESLDVEVRRWSSGKEGNLRALLSTLQYILGSDSGWQSIPLTDVLTAAGVKKAYRKATLCVHPDKLQQRGATIQQKYICEKVFDLLKEAWNKFNSEER